MNTVIQRPPKQKQMKLLTAQSTDKTGIKSLIHMKLLLSLLDVI